MTSVSNEAELIAEAERVIGDAEPVRAAGVFGPQDVMKSVVHDQMIASALGGSLGVIVGGVAARERYSDEHDITMKLIVAVTASKIHIVTWADASTPARVYETFDRATTTVNVRHFGLSRILTLDDDDAGTHIKLHGANARYAAQSGPDKDVLAELAKTG